MSVREIAIVLTGTIIPNAAFTVCSDPGRRRREYLDAIHYYQQFAPVYFLENSSYCLVSDASFIKIPNLMIKKLPPSASPEKGKGYQEFEMIDAWLEGEKDPPWRWIKITGRYIYLNFRTLFEDCLSDTSYRLIIDRHKHSKMALSSLFCVDTEYYLGNLAGLYHDCDDRSGKWIERVIYDKLTSLPKKDYRIFSVEPRLTGISGSNGSKLESSQVKYFVKSLLRRLNYALDRNHIWYSR